MPTQQSKKPQLNFKYLIATRRFLLLSLMLSGVSLLVFFVIIVPRIQNVQSSITVLRTDRDKLVVLQHKLKTLENVTQIDAYQQREAINTILPSYKPLLPLMAGFEQIATEHTIIVSSFDISPGSISTDSSETKIQSTKLQSQTIESMEIQTTVIGTIDNLNGFFASLDTLAPLTELTSVSLTPLRRGVSPDDTQPQFPFEAQLAIVSYFYQDQPALSPTQKLPEISTISQTVLPKLKDFRLQQRLTAPSQQFPGSSLRDQLF